MSRIFIAYCMVLISALAYANHNGYVYANFFSSQSQTGHSSGGQYHK